MQIYYDALKDPQSIFVGFDQGSSNRLKFLQRLTSWLLVCFYKDCEHYPEESDDFKTCKSENYDGLVWSGEATKKNLKKGLMRRLRYNPLWQSMLEEIKNHFDVFK